MTSHPDKRSHLLSLLHDFETGILATHTVRGGIRGRPMGIAEIQTDGDLYFCAGLDSPKISEIGADPHVAVFFQGKTKWVSLTGNAKVVKDRALIHKLWKPDWKVWFPEGKDDPNLCLIRVEPIEGEYWDNSGTRGARFVIEAAKALVKGTTPETGDENAKVKLS